jgi:type I restriction-modification system DNA methylase subunit
MITNDIINHLLGITESYQAPQKMLEKMLDGKKRVKLFDSFLEHEPFLDYEWFQGYFENEHSDRKVKKQDFTPNSVSQLLAGLSSQSKKYFESTAGTGGIMIQHWQKQRVSTHPVLYDPRAYWYQVEELSDRAIPFLIFNMAIRGMNGIVLHGDSLSREFKEAYFIRNDSEDFMAYSEVIKMPHTDALKKELGI